MIEVLNEDKKVLQDLGQKIKAVRINKHLTQSALAQLCKCEKAAMSRIESGHINLTLLTLQKISKALEVPISELLS